MIPDLDEPRLFIRFSVETAWVWTWTPYNSRYSIGLGFHAGPFSGTIDWAKK